MRSQLLVAACLVSLTGPALADGDAAKGEKVARVCMACHDVKAKTLKTGPYLTGLIGRKVASVEGYTYSDAMKGYGATGAVWDEATFDKYIENPKTVVPGTKMAYAGLKKPDQRADLIAFLKTTKAE